MCVDLQLREPVSVEWRKQRAEASPVCLALGNVYSCRHLFTIFLSQFPNGSCSVSLRMSIFLALYHCERCLKEMMLSFMLTVYELLLANSFDHSMSAAWSYYYFWLSGLIHNFLFKILEGFWAPVIRDSFKIIVITFLKIFLYWLNQFNCHGGNGGCSGRRESKDLCQTFLLGVISGCLCWCTTVS